MGIHAGGAEPTLLRAPSATSSAGGSMELDVGQLAAARRRLLGSTAVIGGTMLAYFVAYQTVWADQATTVGRVVAPATVLFCAALSLFVWRAEPTRKRLVYAALLFHLVLGLALAAMEPYDLIATDRPYTLISWNCVNILLVPVLVPSTTRVVVGYAFLLACLTPLGFLALAGVAGAPELSANVYASLWTPPFVCALATGVPSNMMSSLRRDLSKARRLGAYELVEQLGVGGMGEVWRATHRFLARPAAIKLIRPELLGADSSKRAAQRFEREAQAIATLESPHTVKLYDFGVADDGAFYYVMELLRGIDLHRLVSEHGPMPPERAVQVLLQVCDSLAEAHALGLIHRDIKAANLFIGPRGGADDVVRVLDFGLVKDRELEGGDDVGLTHDGQIQGTPSTIAPEAALGKQEVDGRADIYALGCVAHYLVTGHNVFEADTAMEMVVAHVSQPPEPPSARSEQALPEAFDAVVLDCLAKAPDDRIGSAKELARRLRQIEGLEPWSEERRHTWWEVHHPEVLRGR